MFSMDEDIDIFTFLFKGKFIFGLSTLMSKTDLISLYCTFFYSYLKGDWKSLHPVVCWDFNVYMTEAQTVFLI